MGERLFLLRLRLEHADRAPPATLPERPAAGTASAPGFSIRFVKRGADGSGKATLVSLGADEPLVARRALRDRPPRPPEPRSRRGQPLSVATKLLQSVIAAYGRQRRVVSTYCALPEACDASLLPFDWYLALTLAGAQPTPASRSVHPLALPAAGDNRPRPEPSGGPRSRCSAPRGSTIWQRNSCERAHRAFPQRQPCTIS